MFADPWDIVPSATLASMCTLKFDKTCFSCSVSPFVRATVEERMWEVARELVGQMEAERGGGRL